jgi:hypothetical protein
MRRSVLQCSATSPGYPVAIIRSAATVNGMSLIADVIYLMCYVPVEGGAAPLRDTQTGRLLLFSSAGSVATWCSRTTAPLQVVPVSGRRVLDSRENVSLDPTDV